MDKQPDENSDILWNEQILALFEELMRTGPPEAFRESATNAIRREAKRNASARQSISVEKEDLVRACISVTPAAFRDRMINHLVEYGIDVDPYV